MTTNIFADGWHSQTPGEEVLLAVAKACIVRFGATGSRIAVAPEMTGTDDIPCILFDAPNSGSQK